MQSVLCVLNKMNIIFFGDTEFSRPSREALIKNGYDLTVIGKRDGSLKDDKLFEYFKNLNPDLCIVADYGRIIPSRYLETPKYSFINIHPSLLPKYRGPSPIQTAILNGDSKTGVTIMVVDEEVDHGPILAQREWKSLISNLEFLKLRGELAELGAELLVETLPKYVSGEIKPKPQDHSEATSTKMFSREDGKINWNEPAEKIYNQIRALNPEPGTWSNWQKRILNIKESGIWNLESGINDNRPGNIVKLSGEVAVATKTCYLILKQIQLEGRRITNAKDFVNGHPDFIGSILE